MAPMWIFIRANYSATPERPGYDDNYKIKCKYFTQVFTDKNIAINVVLENCRKQCNIELYYNENKEIFKAHIASGEPIQDWGYHPDCRSWSKTWQLLATDENGVFEMPKWTRKPHHIHCSRLEDVIKEHKRNKKRDEVVTVDVGDQASISNVPDVQVPIV